MLGRTPSDVISESNELFTARDIFGSFIRLPKDRSFLIAISDLIDFKPYSF